MEMQAKLELVTLLRDQMLQVPWRLKMPNGAVARINEFFEFAGGIKSCPSIRIAVIPAFESP